MFNGPVPQTALFASAVDEQAGVAAFIRRAIADGINPDEIGVFVRTRDVIGRARAAVKTAGMEPSELTVVPGSISTESSSGPLKPGPNPSESKS